MSECNFPRQWLHAWLDGEAGRRAAQTRDHLEHCRECAREVEAWRAASRGLTAMIDDAVGDIEPLRGLQSIRDRITVAESGSWSARLRAHWDDMWRFRRRALAGAIVAAALGALVAPGVVYWLGRVAPNAALPLGPAVVVESLEVGDDTTAVVIGAEGGTTTLIWVEPASDGEKPKATH